MKLFRYFFIIFLFIGFSVSNSAAGGESNMVNKTELEKLSNMKIYFGHQSVGFNILDGVKDIDDGKFNIVEISENFNFNKSGFYHSRIGSNGGPISKIDNFYENVMNGGGETADVVFLKLCYVDINAETDVEAVFNHYVKVMTELAEKYPKLKIVHFTVPLIVNESTWKTKIKSAIKKSVIWEYEGNKKRNQYNEMIKQYYDGKEPVFDIAKFESTRPDNTESTFEYGGKTYLELNDQYSSDGGHLNETGRKWIAAHLLSFLTDL